MFAFVCVLARGPQHTCLVFLSWEYITLYWVASCCDGQSWMKCPPSSPLESISTPSKRKTCFYFNGLNIECTQKKKTNRAGQRKNKVNRVRDAWSTSSIHHQSHVSRKRKTTTLISKCNRFFFQLERISNYISHNSRWDFIFRPSHRAWRRPELLLHFHLCWREYVFPPPPSLTFSIFWHFCLCLNVLVIFDQYSFLAKRKLPGCVLYRTRNDGPFQAVINCHN